MNATQSFTLFTTGEIAIRGKVGIHRVQYFLRTWKDRAAVVVGGRRLFTGAQADAILAALKKGK